MIRPLRGLVILGCGLVLVACSGLTSPSTSNTSPPTQAAATVSSTVPDTAAPTTIPPTTTTTIPARQLDLTLQPSVASIVIEEANGQSRQVETPFSGMVQGPVTVTVTAPGYNPINDTLEMRDDSSVALWLDPEGQLLRTISRFATGPAPKQVAFTPSGAELWVTSLAGDGFEVYDPLTGTEIASVDLPEAGAVEVIFNQAGTLAYISQMETASVYEIDTATKQVLRNFVTGGSWTKVMALSPDESTLYASNWVSNDVSEIDLATGEVRRRLPTVTTPRGLYVTPDGAEIYVAGFENGDIQVIDLDTGEGRVIFSTGGSMRHLVGDPTTGLLYASDMSRNMTYVIDTATDEVRELAATDRVPNTIDLGAGGQTLFVSNRGRNNSESYYLPGPEWGSVVVIDAQTGEYLDAIVCGNQTTGLDISPDGTMLAYSDFLDDRVTVMLIPPYQVLAAGGGGRWEQHRAEIEK